MRGDFSYGTAKNGTYVKCDDIKQSTLWLRCGKVKLSPQKSVDSWSLSSQKETLENIDLIFFFFSAEITFESSKDIIYRSVNCGYLNFFLFVLSYQIMAACQQIIIYQLDKVSFSTFN